MKWFHGLLFAALLVATPALAQVSPPANAPQVTVSDHGVQVTVFTKDVGLGAQFMIAERTIGLINWVVVWMSEPSVDNFKTEIATKGTAALVVQGLVGPINQQLAAHYPAIVAGGTGPNPATDPFGAVTYALINSYKLVIVPGAPPAFGLK